MLKTPQGGIKQSSWQMKESFKTAPCMSCQHAAAQDHRRTCSHSFKLNRSHPVTTGTCSTRRQSTGHGWQWHWEQEEKGRR